MRISAELALELLGGYGFNRCKPPALAVVTELHPAGNLGEERIVGASAYVDAGLDACAPLAHDDRAAGD
jgi:hypothetical protein